MSKDAITTLLDLTGLALLALGIGVLVAGLILGAVVLAVGLGLAVSGAVLLAGSRVAVWTGKPPRAPRWWKQWVGRGEQR